MGIYLRALRYFWPDRAKIALLFALIAIGTLAGLLQVWPMIVLVDSVMSTQPKQDWVHQLVLGILPNGQIGQVIGLAVLTLLLRLVQEAEGRFRTLLNFRIGYNGLMRVRCDLYRKQQALNLAYHRAQPQGDAIYRLITDTCGCHTILNVIVSLLVAGVMLIVMTGIMLTRNVPLTLAALSIAPLLFATNVWFGRRMKHRALEAKELESEFTTTIQRSMSAIGLVQAFRREDYEFTQFQSSVGTSVRAWLRLHWQEVCYGLTISIIFGIGGAIVFGYGGYLVYRDQFVLRTAGGMSVGDLMLFMTYLAMLYDPMCKLSGAGASMLHGLAGAERVFEVLDQDPGISDRPDGIALPQQPRTLRLENVSFRYGDGKQVLDGVNVNVKPGEMVAFVGSSGVGKSTLLNLLPRFYDPCSGAIKLDEHDIRDVKLADLRKHVALVLQESVILPTTIAENIAYGRPRATLEEVREVAVMAGASAFIEQTPDGYATKITEGGQNLSGGQRQRIAIARALLTEAPIMVLDEPTSALDPHHEQLITATLANLKGMRTIVIVSHRLSTVVNCDQIFVMHEGRIVERGTHRELVDRRGHYYEMARFQMQLEEPVSQPGAPVDEPLLMYAA